MRLGLRCAGRALLASVAAALAGCGASNNDRGPGGVTVGEARALEEAAEMLDERRDPDQAAPTPTPSPGATAPEENEAR